MHTTTYTPAECRKSHEKRTLHAMRPTGTSPNAKGSWTMGDRTAKAADSAGQVVLDTVDPACPGVTMAHYGPNTDPATMATHPYRITLPDGFYEDMLKSGSLRPGLTNSRIRSFLTLVTRHELLHHLLTGVNHGIRNLPRWAAELSGHDIPEMVWQTFLDIHHEHWARTRGIPGDPKRLKVKFDFSPFCHLPIKTDKAGATVARSQYKAAPSARLHPCQVMQDLRFCRGSEIKSSHQTFGPQWIASKHELGPEIEALDKVEATWEEWTWKYGARKKVTKKATMTVGAAVAHYFKEACEVARQGRSCFALVPVMRRFCDTFQLDRSNTDSVGDMGGVADLIRDLIEEIAGGSGKAIDKAIDELGEGAKPTPIIDDDGPKDKGRDDTSKADMEKGASDAPEVLDLAEEAEKEKERIQDEAAATKDDTSPPPPPADRDPSMQYGGQQGRPGSKALAEDVSTGPWSSRISRHNDNQHRVGDGMSCLDAIEQALVDTTPDQLTDEAVGEIDIDAYLGGHPEMYVDPDSGVADGNEIARNRKVCVIVDCSGSMGWKGGKRLDGRAPCALTDAMEIVEALLVAHDRGSMGELHIWLGGRSPVDISDIRIEELKHVANCAGCEGIVPSIQAATSKGHIEGGTMVVMLTDGCITDAKVNKQALRDMGVTAIGAYAGAPEQAEELHEHVDIAIVRPTAVDVASTLAEMIR